MILSDEEIKEMIHSSKHETYMDLCRDIERAVLAKASQQVRGEQAQYKEPKVLSISKKALADEVMAFVGGIVGAYEAGFVDSPVLTIGQLFQVARNHVKDSYDVDVKSLSEQMGEDFARECNPSSKAMPTPKQDQELRYCNECDWKGATDRMLGAIGPLCPECGETTGVEPSPRITDPALPQAAAIPEGLCIDPELKRLALDYVRCGIGSNYSSESFCKRMGEIYVPFRKMVDLIPISAAPKPEESK